MMIPGTVKNIMPYGVFIQLVGGLIGLAPNKVSINIQSNEVSLDIHFVQ